MDYCNVLLIAFLLATRTQGQIQHDREDSVPDDSSSMELQPLRQERSEGTLQEQNRPILELVLGVLDTFHSSAQSELKRIKTRSARHSYQLKQQEEPQTQGYKEAAMSSTSTEGYGKTTATGRKRFSISRS